MRRRDLTSLGNSGQLALEETNVRLKAVSKPYLNGEKVVAASLGFLARGVLHEEGLGDLREVVERAWWQRVEPF